MTLRSTQHTLYLATTNTCCYQFVLFIEIPNQVQNTNSKQIAVSLS